MSRGRTRKACVSDRHPCRTYDTFSCITLERLAKTNGMWPPRSGKRLGTVKILISLRYFNIGMQDRNHQFYPTKIAVQILDMQYISDLSVCWLCTRT